MGHSILKGRDLKVEKEIKEEQVMPQVKEKLYLFTTKTCPNCRIVKKMLAKANIPYECIDAEEEVELTRRFSIMQAPTLVAVTDKQYRKYTNASDIKKYIETLK